MDETQRTKPVSPRAARPRATARLGVWALPVALLALTLSAVVAGAQSSVDPQNPAGTYDSLYGGFDDSSSPSSNVPDTSSTPKHQGKEDASKIWAQVDGARFADAGRANLVKVTVGGVTSYDDNLFKVSFRNDLHGFAGGERCTDSNPDLWHEEDIARAGCRPVLYEYTDTRSRGGTAGWKEVALPGGIGDPAGADHERPGFVGAIAWIDAHRAMVVGGTGIFPRREPSYRPECQNLEQDRLAPWGSACDPAGLARVWLYDSARGEPWCELKVGEGHDGCPALPGDDPSTPWFDGMRGLTAVDFKPDAFRMPREVELGFVGGLGQIWRWQKTTDPNAQPFVEGFDQRIDSHSPMTLLTGRTQPNVSTSSTATVDGTAQPPEPARKFRFRVRDLRFAPQDGTRAFAVTSGCCTPYNDPRGAAASTVGAQDRPAILTYSDFDNDTAPAHWGPGWTIEGGADPNGTEEAVSDTGLAPDKPAIPTWVPHYHDALTQMVEQVVPGVQDTVWSTPWPGTKVDSLRERGQPVPDVPSTKLTPYQQLQQKNDSYYALVTRPTTSSRRPSAAAASVLATPGGERADSWAEDRERWLSIDGWVADGGTVGFHPEWRVGELRTPAARGGRGRQGLVLSAEWKNPPAYDDGYPRTTYDWGSVWGCAGCKTEEADATRVTVGVVSGSYRPTDPDRVLKSQAALARLVSSYTVNWVEMVDSAGLATGQGWAVGDHGAILHLDPEGGPSGGPSGGRVGGEPDPPPGLVGGEAKLSASGPFAGLRPVGVTEPGQVPALASRPVERLSVPRMVSAGSPDATHKLSDTATARLDNTEDVGSIVMNRDGSEGWALGANPMIADPTMSPDANRPWYGRASLYHYDGAEWRRCDPKGIPGQLEADPACAGLAPLVDLEGGGVGHVKLVAAARVPYDRDGDPNNDDDFEVLALGTPYRHQGDAWDLPVMARFQDGRWRIDDGLHDRLREITDSSTRDVELVDVAFTAPDDGWVLGRQASSPGTPYRLFHWDGTDWSSCGATASCGGGRIPVQASSAASNGKNLGQVVGLEAAGDRVYLHGWRVGTNLVGGLGDANTQTRFQTYAPLILYHQRGTAGWTDGSRPGEDGGGYDPGYVPPGGQADSQKSQGKVVALSVVQRRDGGYAGWAIGRFYDYVLPPDQARNQEDPAYGDQYNQGGSSYAEPTAIAMRLDQRGGQGSWAYFQDSGALGDLMGPALKADLSQPDRLETEPGLMASLPDGRALIAQRKSGVLFGFAPERGRFDVVQSQRPGFEPQPVGGRNATYPVEVNGVYQALAPDGQGGFWAAVKNRWEDNQHPGTWWASGGQVYFFHYTDRPHRPVFGEVPHPLGGASERFTALAGAADGSLWAATDNGRLAHYDRVTGWETLAIPGWDPGRVVTRRSEVNALAVNEDGIGVAVGPRGRIADLSADKVVLDPAAGKRCDAATAPPCGTGFDLRAAAVAPDGSALVAGAGLTVLWRPAGDVFRRIARPPGDAKRATITGVSFPRPDRAYLTSDSGYIYAGQFTPGGWIWTADNATVQGDVLIFKDEDRRQMVAEKLAIDADGHGYAIGPRGLLLERTPAEGWKRLRGPGSDDLTAITLGHAGKGVLIGGQGGVIWTLVGDRFVIARPADYSRMPDPSDSYAFRAVTGPLTGAIVGLALLPGVKGGQVEAWAASEARATATNRMFHYASDGDEPLLSPEGRAKALPDAPAPRPGEVAFAAFGNSDCDLRQICMVRRGTLTRNEVIGERIVGELQARFADPGSGFALFTGDATFTAGLPASSTHRSDRTGSVEANLFASITVRTDPYGLPEQALAPVAQRQWNRMVGDPLERAGLAVYAAPGPGDLSRPLYRCDGVNTAGLSGGGCGAVAEDAKTGDNLSWRDAMAARAAPWGSGEPPTIDDGGGLSFAPVAGADALAVTVRRQRVDPDGSGPVPETKVGGGARTHYAMDASRERRLVARVVVVDTSLRSLQASDAIQQPLERNGQLAWLERMICFEGQQTVRGEACSRKPGQPAIVLTSTPTYSYGTTNPGEVNTTDATQLEQLLLRYHASVVVSGRLGWNTRYWATAPGVHEPCPGGTYQDTPPGAQQRICGRAEADAATGGAARGQKAAQTAVTSLSQTLRGLGAPAPPTTLGGIETTNAVGGLTGILPFVVSAGGGGPLGSGAPGEQLKASDGYWNGYSIVRVPADGDPAGVVVEQRPIFDWLHLSAVAHVLNPGQKLVLRGVGREPIGYGATVTTRFDELTTAAITHRYDLVEADPAKPYLPKIDQGNGQPHGYVPIDPTVATIDPESGQVIAQRGNHGRVYALAILSVGSKAATWPLVFEPKRSYTPPPAPRLTVASIPAVRVLAFNPTSIQPPASTPPSSPPPPIGVDLALPGPPGLPNVPTAAGPPVTPPAPPAPPVPPAGQQAAPLNLAISPAGISVPPTTGVTAQPTPPVNPSPPGGARKEAKQHQASAAKSEEGGGSPSEQRVGVDSAGGPPGAEGAKSMTRRDRIKPAADGFTPLDRAHAQPSAWTTGLQWGGGVGLMALALALGFTTLRPTPRGRRHPPVVPALARNASWRRRA